MSLTFARSLTDLFRISSETRLDDVLLNRILAAIELRLKPLESQRGDVDTAIAQVRQVGLDRINEVLTPAIANILEIQERGFLIASSATPATLGLGNVLALEVTDEAQRALFTPSPFTALTRESTADDYAIARTIAYDQETGEYLCEIVSFEGDEGPHDDWVIGALAGPTIAMFSMLADATAARAEAEAAAGSAGESADQAAGAADASAGSAATAVAKALLAAAWAEADEDVPVEPGKYSARHHALKAAASAILAATFDPGNYYQKAETYSQAQADAAIEAAVNALIGGAPGALNTLDELAAALNDDASFAASVTNALALKANAAALGTMSARAKATTAQVRARSADVGLTADEIRAALAPVAVAYAATLNLDCEAVVSGECTLTGNLVLKIANPIPGAMLVLRVVGDSAAARTVSFHADFKGPLPTVADVTSTKAYDLYVRIRGAADFGVVAVQALGS